MATNRTRRNGIMVRVVFNVIVTGTLAYVAWRWHLSRLRVSALQCHHTDGGGDDNSNIIDVRISRATTRWEIIAINGEIRRRKIIVDVTT